MTTDETNAPQKTILCIEDDESSSSLVRRVLEACGYRVLLARNGLTGLELARRERPDLILMDINMPHMSGEVVTTRLRTIPDLEQTPIVAVTAATQPGNRERFIVAGGTGYIHKPVDVDKLPGQVDEYLKGRREDIPSEEVEQHHMAYTRSLVQRLEAKVRELELVNRDLRRMDKIKNDFIALTSHEIRTPLTLVRGYMDLLRDDAKKLEGDTGASIVLLADNLNGAIERLTSVLNKVVILSRLAMGAVDPAIGPISPAQVVKEAADQIRGAASTRRIQVTVAEGGWPPLIPADATLLKIALSNVLSNALKYTPDGGEITVERKVVDDFLDVSITDTGIGIEPEEQLLIFEEFYTASDTLLHSSSQTAFKGGGMGLGLAIAQSIIQAHQGQIWVESPGRDEEKCPGSTFHILLPTSLKPPSDSL